MRNLIFALLILGGLLVAGHTSANGDDSDYLYQNGHELTIQLFENGGQPSFSATRSDGKVLRGSFAGEQFYIDHSSGALGISYAMSEQTGGVDISYTITNSTASAQTMPDFVVDGLGYAAQASSDHLHILNLSTHPYLHERPLSETTYQNSDYFNVNGVEYYPYPRVYSPVVVAHDDDFVAGSALHFDFTQHSLYPLLRVRHSVAGAWGHLYQLDARSAQIPAGETWNITLSMRFAAPRYWVLTLHPYKTYFEAQFGAQRDIVPRDTLPISGVNLSYGTVAYYNYQNCLNDGVCQEGVQPSEATILARNLHGYNYYIRLNRDGLDGIDAGDPKFVTTYINRMLTGGYQRTMLWAMSGQFWDCPPGQVSNAGQPGSENCLTNIPHQFMSDLPPNVQSTLGALAKFEQNGIDLGFWWGRAGQVPVPWQWNPDSMTPLDPSNASHADPTDTELDLAVARGAKAVGLDAFGAMAPANHLAWLRHLKARAPGVDFWAEGSTNDYRHTLTSLFLQPTNIWGAGELADDEIAKPDLLAQYLNPGAEVITYFGSSATHQYIQNLVKWGYTPLVVAHADIYNIPLLDVNNLDFSLAACFDGVDNDGDGYTDFPYDVGCISAAGESEVGPHVVALPLITNKVQLNWEHNALYEHYDIWRSEQPYFTPMGGPRATVDAAPWQYEDAALGDAAHNYFYVVQGVAADGRAYANRVGEFDFNLTPGE